MSITGLSSPAGLLLAGQADTLLRYPHIGRSHTFGRARSGRTGRMLEAVRPDAPRVVVLIGSNNLQNRLLAKLIDERIDCTCLLRAADELGALRLDGSALALLDIDGIGAKAIGDRLQKLAARAPSCS